MCSQATSPASATIPLHSLNVSGHIECLTLAPMSLLVNPVLYFAKNFPSLHSLPGNLSNLASSKFSQEWLAILSQ